jgi:hypothetical protein
METAIEESPLKVSLIEILLAIIAIFHVWQFAVFYRCREYYLIRTRSPKPNVAYQSDGNYSRQYIEDLKCVYAN